MSAAERTPADISAILGIAGEAGPEADGSPTDDASRVDEILGEYYAPGATWNGEHACADAD